VAVSLSKGVMYSLASSISYALQMMIISAILSRYASPESFGAFGYALALLTPLLLVFNLNLRTIVLTNTDENRNSQRDYFVLTVVLTILFLIVSLIISLLNDGEARLLIISASVLKSVEMLTSISTASNYKRLRTDLVAICQIARTIAILVSFSIVYYLTSEIWVALTLAGISSYFLYLILDWKLTTLRDEVSISAFHLTSLKRLNISVKSIGLVAAVPVINALLQNSPRYMLNDQGLLGDVGVVTILMYVAMPGNLILMSLSTVLIPMLNKQWFDGMRSSYLRTSLYGVAGAILMGGIVLLLGYYFGDLFIGTLFSETYTGHNTELSIMLSAAVLWYASTMLNVAVNAAKGYKISLFASCAGALVVAFSYSLLDQPGVSALSWALNIYLTGMLMRFILLACGLFYISGRPLAHATSNTP